MFGFWILAYHIRILAMYYCVWELGASHFWSSKHGVLEIYFGCVYLGYIVWKR